MEIFSKNAQKWSTKKELKMSNAKMLLEDMFLTEGSGIIVESDKRDAYMKFFRAKLEKYNVNSPAELSDEDKSKFFDEISSEWKESKE